jgi:hypothetical protein
VIASLSSGVVLYILVLMQMDILGWIWHPVNRERSELNIEINRTDTQKAKAKDTIRYTLSESDCAGTKASFEEEYE